MANYAKLAIYVFKENKKLKRQILDLQEIIFQTCRIKEYLTVNEVCEIFKISRRTFDRYRSEGLKTLQPKKNGKRLIRKIDIENFLTKRNHGR